jgi:hypothetical protein
LRAATADAQDTVQKIPQGNYQNHTRIRIVLVPEKPLRLQPPHLATNFQRFLEGGLESDDFRNESAVAGMRADIDRIKRRLDLSDA